jgi:hypothetical protein
MGVLCQVRVIADGIRDGRFTVFSNNEKRGHGRERGFSTVTEILAAFVKIGFLWSILVLITFLLSGIRWRKRIYHVTREKPQPPKTTRGINLIRKRPVHQDIEKIYDVTLHEYRYKDCHLNVYFLVRRGKVVYVGQSAKLSRRVFEHRRDKKFDSVWIISCSTEKEMDLKERHYIKKFNPFYNNRAGKGI